MVGSIANELYSEALQLSSEKVNPGSATNLEQDELCGINLSLSYLFPN